MAALTLGQMKTRVFARVNKTSTTSIQGVTLDTIAGEELLAAIRLYEGKPWWFLEDNDAMTLDGGTSQEALPANFGTPIDLRIQVNGTWLGWDDDFRPATYREVKARRLNTDTGTPSRWAIFGGNLEFDKVADANYTLDFDFYKRDATLPSADSVSSVFFDEAQELILNRAVEYIYANTLHDSEMAATYRQKAEEWERELTKRHNRRVPRGALRG